MREPHRLNTNVQEAFMNWRKSTILLFLFFSVLVFSFTTTAQDGMTKQEPWKQIKNNNGVKVFARPSPGSKYRELLAKGTVKVPFEVGVEMVKDCDCYYQWYGMCRELYVIKRKSEKDFLMYFVLDMPFVTDRDVVVRVTGDWDMKKRQGWIRLQSVKSDYKKSSGYVRMPKIDGDFSFKEVGPDLFSVTYRVHADLGGSVPAWMVNIAAKKHPYETAMGAKKHVKSEKYYKRAEKLYGKSFKRYE